MRHKPESDFFGKSIYLRRPQTLKSKGEKNGDHPLKNQRRIETAMSML